MAANRMALLFPADYTPPIHPQQPFPTPYPSPWQVIESLALQLKASPSDHHGVPTSLLAMYAPLFLFSNLILVELNLKHHIV